MSRQTVWIERIDGKIVRIFRSTHSEDFSRAIGAGTAETCPRKDAVGEIRTTVWQRCCGRCEWCGKPVTETGPLWKRMHMHEKLPKGSGGEVSLENCVGICQRCHEDSPEAHGNRKPQFTSTKTIDEIMEGD